MKPLYQHTCEACKYITSVCVDNYDYDIYYHNQNLYYRYGNENGDERMIREYEISSPCPPPFSSSVLKSLWPYLRRAYQIATNVRVNKSIFD